MWTYLTTSDASLFLWNTSAASEWGMDDFTKMVNQIENDSLYGYLLEDKLIAMARLSWIVQPWSAYLWIWVDPLLRRPLEDTKRAILINLFNELVIHIRDKLKVKKLIAACLEKAHARLCTTFGAELKCVLPNLYHKNKSGYICLWDWESYE